MHVIVKALLEAFDWDEAIDVIRKYGDSRDADKYLAMPRTSFVEDKVRKILAELEIEVPVHLPPATSHLPLATSAPTDFKELLQRRNQCLAVIDHHRGELPLLPTDEDRLACALKILETQKELRDIWRDIDYYEQTGQMPVREDKQDMEQLFAGANALQIEKIRRNYVSYVSKVRKGLRSADMLPHYQAVIAEAERRLSAV
jgi:hypothetical protein